MAPGGRPGVGRSAAEIPVAIGGAFDPPASQPKRVQSCAPGGPPPEGGASECDAQANATRRRIVRGPIHKTKAVGRVFLWLLRQGGVPDAGPKRRRGDSSPAGGVSL